MNYLKSLLNKYPIVAGWLYVIAYYHTRLLSNTSTPGGDAKRSLGYFETAKNSSSYLPFWDPFSAMGKPSYADPEWLFYRSIAPLFNAIPREYYNLSYNLCLLFLIFLLAFVFYKLFLALKIDNIVSASFATVAVCSGFVWPSIESGRLNTLVILIATFSLIPIYLKWQKNKKAIAMISLVLCISVTLVLSGYYAIVGFLFFASFVLGSHWQRFNSFSKALYQSILQLSLQGTFALLVSALFLLPLIEFQLSNIVSQDGWNTSYNALNVLSTPRLFVPFFGERPLLSSVFPHISFVLLPGLVIFFQKRRFRDNKALVCLSLYALACFLLAIGFALSTSHFNHIYQTIPILNLIRWANLYSNYVIIILFIYSAIGLTSIESATQLRKAIFYSALFLGTAIATNYLVFDINTQVNKLSIQTVALITLFLVSAWFTSKVFTGKKTIYCMLLIGLCLHLMTPKAAFYSHKSLVETPRTQNLVDSEKASALTQNFEPGIRQYCKNMLLCPLAGVPGVYGANGFSMFFSNETRSAFKTLSNREINAKRPHWVKRARCPELLPLGLEMANIKLVFCDPALQPPGEKWQKLLGNEEHTLWLNQADNSSFKVFHSAKQGNGRETMKDIEELWNAGIMLNNSINDEGSREINSIITTTVTILSWKDDSFSILVESSEPAYIFSSIIFSSGWNAKLNSNKLAILKAFNSYQAIRVPAGNSTVEFNYRPLTWQYGKWISIISLTLLVILALYFQRLNNSGSNAPTRKQSL